MPEDPAPLRPAPINEAGWKITDGDGKDLELEDCWLAGYIFTDGACYPAAFRSGWRAGWAAVMVDESGKVLKVLQGPVWSTLPQTAPSAEWCAWSAVHHVLQGKATIWTDCLGVQQQAGAEGMLKALRSAARAGTWIRAAGWRAEALRKSGESLERPQTVTKKTKAHVTISEQLSKEARWEAASNHVADEKAKEAARFNPLPADGEQAIDRQMAEDCGKVLAYAVEALCLWPAVPQGLERKVVAPRPHCSRREQQGPQHLWQFTLGRWSCQTCVATCFRTDAENRGDMRDAQARRST